MVEPLTDAVYDRSLERVVVQDVLVDESGELWLAACDVLRFAADARPDRIDLIEGPRGPRLILSHEPRTPSVSRSPHRALLSHFRSRQVRQRVPKSSKQRQSTPAQRPAHGSWFMAHAR